MDRDRKLCSLEIWACSVNLYVYDPLTDEARVSDVQVVVVPQRLLVLHVHGSRHEIYNLLSISSFCSDSNSPTRLILMLWKATLCYSSYLFDKVTEVYELSGGQYPVRVEVVC